MTMTLHIYTLGTLVLTFIFMVNESIKLFCKNADIKQRSFDIHFIESENIVTKVGREKAKASNPCNGTLWKYPSSNAFFQISSPLKECPQIDPDSQILSQNSLLKPLEIPCMVPILSMLVIVLFDH